MIDWIKCLFVVSFVVLKSSAATKCKPLSTFIVDCNICLCEANGQIYSCTKRVCPSLTYPDKFTVEKSPSGHTILRPIPIKNRFYNLDDDLTLTRKNWIDLRKKRSIEKFNFDNELSNEQEDLKEERDKQENIEEEMEEYELAKRLIELENVDFSREKRNSENIDKSERISKSLVLPIINDAELERNILEAIKSDEEERNLDYVDDEIWEDFDPIVKNNVS